MSAYNMPRGLAVAAALFAVLGAAPRAHAGSDQDRWAAHQQLTQAQDLKKNGQLQDALAHFEESQRLDPKLTTLMELADCQERLGKLLEAQASFVAARDKAAHDQLPQSKQRAEQRLAAVEKRLAHLTLQLPGDAPADVQVFRDDVLLEPAARGAPLLLDPGDHVVVVKASGHEDAKFAVKLGEGESQALPISAGPSTAPPAPPPPPKVAPTPPPVNHDAAQLSMSSGSSRRPIGILAGSLGIVGIAGGSALWATSYRDSGIDQNADRNLLIGQISVAAGGALLVTGIVLLATAPSGDAKTARLRVTPTLNVGSRATVLGAVGEF